MATQTKPKATKGSKLEKPIQQETTSPLVYQQEESVYIANLQRRLEKAKNLRDQTYIEFDGLSYIDYWWANERGANTMIDAKKNKADTNFQSGTLRTKMLALLSSYQGLNLGADIKAFNENDIIVNNLGNALEDVIDKTQEVENDEEWRMLRQYEMLKHGYVFVEEIWHQPWEVEKKVTSGFYGNINGVQWTTKMVKGMGHPKRTILPGPSVYLGDLSKYMIEDQPYIFTIQSMSYEEAEKIYGGWERWKYVTKTKRHFSGIAGYEMVSNAWRLIGEIGDNQVEIIKYQDKPNKEYQIVINGVPMLPMGYPFPWGHGEYSVAQQNLEPIRFDFAYGKSFIFKNKNIVAVLDEMMKLAVLKTKQSFTPPMLNLSDRVISRDVLMPGQISRGIRKGELAPVYEQVATGVTNAEFGMIQEVKNFIDSNTVSQTFTGAPEKGGKTTATQIVELQRQARIMMGLLVLAASLLEKKLSTKRLMILLENWFDPIDERVDEARKILINRYRITSIPRNIEGEGAGMRMVMPTDDKVTSQEVMATEDRMKEQIGVPVRIIVLNPKEIQSAKLTWVVTVNPKEKKSSEMSKLLFGAMIADAMSLGLRLNPDYIEERFAQVWDEDPVKMFKKETVLPPMPEMPGAPGAPGAPTAPATSIKPKISPQIKVPGNKSNILM